MIAPRVLLTQREVAARLGVTTKTVGRWLRAGRLDYTWTAGRHARIFADSLSRDPTRRGRAWHPRPPTPRHASTVRAAPLAAEPDCPYCYEPGRHGPGGAGCLNALDSVARRLVAARRRTRLTLVWLFLLLLAAPAAAEDNPLKWSQHRPIADWLSTGLVAGTITADVVHAWRAEDRPRALWGVTCRNAVAGGGAELLKLVIHRWRPDHSDQKSTPSGHTAEAFANSTYASFTVTMPIAAAVGYLRPAANRHYASDVAFGAGLGLLARKVCP